MGKNNADLKECLFKKAYLEWQWYSFSEDEYDKIISRKCFSALVDVIEAAGLFEEYSEWKRKKEIS